MLLPLPADEVNTNEHIDVNNPGWKTIIMIGDHMKKNYINKLIIGITVVVLAFHNCGEDKQIYGPPTISKVTLINSLDSAITAADMGEWVAIHGENLFNIEYIKFNDIEVNLKEIYSDDKAAYTQVPKDMPTEL